MNDFIVEQPKVKKITVQDGKGVIPNGTVLKAEVDYFNSPLDNNPTPLNKGSLLSDETAALYALSGEGATVDGALGAVPNMVQRAKASTFELYITGRLTKGIGW